MSKIKTKLERGPSTYKRPDQRVESITPTSELFVLAHLGFPDFDVEDWTLTVDGLVDNPAVFDLAALQNGFDKRTIEAVLKCSGNPLKPTSPTRQVANVKWSGFFLSDVLNTVGIQLNATYLWAYGLDHGEFAGQHEKSYLKDLPLFRLQRGDIMLAYELNGEPLSLAHGLPLRLVVPGYYGNNNVKWLHRLRLTSERATGLFTTKLYNDPVADGEGHKPVWDVEPESMLVAPSKNSRLPVGDIDVWGWSWSNCEVRQVEVSVDGGESWAQANLEPCRQQSWQRFSHRFHIENPGQIKLVCRATDVDGRTQPESGARNKYHRVAIDVMNE